ncbi:MAG: DUF350 domain-containing protein [Deltaproteobacteria bacterium]|nr:MAG: DUF350 domain-containing protein [Deltaproteobacteria bacterium]
MEWLSVVLGPLSMAAGVLLLLAVLAAFLWLTGKVEGYDPVNEILLRNNSALGIRYAFYVIAVVFALLGIFDRAQGDSGVVEFALHALLAALLIHLSRYLNDWLILYDFNNNREVIQEQNVAVSIVEGATYLASAYVISGAFYDWESGLWIAVIWFSIGQLLLIVLALLYRAVTRGVAEALDNQNTAIGVSLGGFLLSGGIVCGAVISGPSRGWQHDFIVVITYILIWLALMVIAHFLSELLVFRSSRLSDEIMQQRNIAAALFKGVMFLAVTLGYTHG